MKNTFIIIAFSLAAVATLLGIISTTGISDARDSLRAFHFGSTATFIGVLSVFSLITSKMWSNK